MGVFKFVDIYGYLNVGECAGIYMFMRVSVNMYVFMRRLKVGVFGIVFLGLYIFFWDIFLIY